MSSAVSVLTNSPRISDLTKKNVFLVNLSQNLSAVMQITVVFTTCEHADHQSVFSNSSS